MKKTKKIDLTELEAAAKEYRPSKRPWTKEEDDVLERFYGKVPIGLLAKKLDRTVSSLQNHKDALRGES